MNDVGFLQTGWVNPIDTVKDDCKSVFVGFVRLMQMCRLGEENVWTRKCVVTTRWCEILNLVFPVRVSKFVMCELHLTPRERAINFAVEARRP